MCRRANHERAIAGIAVLLANLALSACSGPTNPELREPGPAAVVAMDSVSALGGRNVEVPIWLSYPDKPEARLDHLGGFDLLFRYDTPALTLINVARGPAISQWEYFTWRTLLISNDPGAQDYGGRIVAIRDWNDGLSPDPPQYYPEGIIATLTFWATSDTDYSGTSQEIEFYSLECGDNAFSPQSAALTSYIANDRFGPDSDDAVTDTMECLRRYTIVPVLEFRHGSVTIEEPPPIAGDINLNGSPFDFGDLVLFSQLYRGETPDVNPEVLSRMIANADCNGDGVPLTLADYDYLLSVLVAGVIPGDVLPPPFQEELRIELVQDGDDWLVAGTSSSPVSGFLFKLISPSGARMSADWEAGYNPGFAAKHWEDTLSLSALADLDTHMPILVGDWPPPIRIRDAGESRPIVVSAEASTPPGVQMTVTVVQ